MKHIFILLITLCLCIVWNSCESVDATCSTGIIHNGACCPSICGQCGGAGCYQASLQHSTRCCSSGILNPSLDIPLCDNSDPPCRLSAQAKPSPVPKKDPTCSTGIASKNKGACCIKACGKCGGSGCGARSRQAKSRCCIGGILNPDNNVPSCDVSLPPCIINKQTPSKSPKPSKSSKPSPSSSPKGKSKFSSFDGKWVTAKVNGNKRLVQRHEACAVMVDGKVVLIGGRGKKPVSVYDPKTRTWETKSRFDDKTQIHHFQCVVHQSSIWMVSSWNMKFPNETNNPFVYEYRLSEDKWYTYPGLPEPRRRGGAASVLKGNLIYVIAGNRGGHGEHATSLNWVDAYNVKTKKWILRALPPMPDAGRDHCGGALMNNGDICVASGRDGGSKGFFRLNIASTYCYSFSKKKWEKKEDFPQPRAGAMVGTTCEGYMMIAGGEGDGKAYKRVDVFDGNKWTRVSDLVEGRHGSGLAFANCNTCGHIFIPSGSGRMGGSPELFTTEEYIPKGSPQNCATY